MDEPNPRPYDSRMNTLRLLVCLGVIAAVQPAFADQVNQCRDASGRRLMTDRPCGDPSLERPSLRPPQIVVEQMAAPDMFRARNKVRNDGAPMAPGQNSAGTVRAPREQGLF